MKIINEGDSSRFTWYVGRRITCDECGFIGECEEDEWQNIHTASCDAREVRIACPTCKTIMSIKRNNNDA